MGLKTASFGPGITVSALHHSKLLTNTYRCHYSLVTESRIWPKFFWSERDKRWQETDSRTHPRIHMLRTPHCKVICLTRKLLLVSTTKSDPSSSSHRPLVRGPGVGGPSVAGGPVPDDSASWEKKHSPQRRNVTSKWGTRIEIIFVHLHTWFFYSLACLPPCPTPPTTRFQVALEQFFTLLVDLHWKHLWSPLSILPVAYHRVCDKLILVEWLKCRYYLLSGLYSILSRTGQVFKWQFTY